MSAGQILNYEKRRDIAWRTITLRAAITILLMLLLFSLVPSGYYFLCNWRYYSIKRKLDSIPGIPYDIGYHRDLDESPRRVVDYVEDHIDSDATKRIVFDPGQGWFEGTGELKVFAFGPLDFETNGQPGLSIGSSAPFAQRLALPYEAKSVPGLIARYDEVIAAMEGWPRNGFIETKSGERYQYDITLNADGREDGTGPIERASP